MNHEKLPSGVMDAIPVVIRSVEDLGNAVQQVRKQQGLAQLDIAGLTGTGNRFIIDLERGKPTLQMGKALLVLQELGLELVLRKKGARK